MSKWMLVLGVLFWVGAATGQPVPECGWTERGVHRCEVIWYGGANDPLMNIWR